MHGGSGSRRRRALIAALASAAVAAVVVAVTLVASPAGADVTGAVRGVGSGRCVDVPNSTTTNGTQVQLWDCNGNATQRWTYTSSKQLMVYGNKCLDANGRGTTNGTITGVQSGLCLDANGAATGNGTKLILWACNGGNNQKWTLRN